MKVEITDNSAEVLEEFQAACERALEKCGLVAEGYAKKLCPVDFGTLRSSITHLVDAAAKVCYVGTNMLYAIYVECGTGIYYPGGRQTPWVYQDAKGNWHLTHGQREQPYIKPSVAEHVSEFRTIIESELQGN
jgi:hypothetical protein